MIKKKWISVFLCTSLIVSGITDGMTEKKIKTAFAMSQYNEAYNENNYTYPFATDRIIIALKPGTISAMDFDSNGVSLIRSLMPKSNSVQSTNDNTVGLYSVPVTSKEGIIDTINKLKSDPSVAYAEPDYIISESDTTTNDPHLSKLYGMSKISATKTWDYYTGGNNVVVGIIDTGIDYNHQDLSSNMWTNPGEIPNNNIDDDNNGYIDDIYGWNFCNNTNNPMDDKGHGTHCAGTIGATGNNNIGVVGVNWTVKMAALKFLNAEGKGNTSDAISAVNYAAQMKFPITNNSWGGGAYSQALRDAINSYQGLFVAAAGNNYGNNNDKTPVYPSSYDCSNILAVAATDANDNLASFGNYGLQTVDVAAPGADIFSTVPNNGYEYKSGTSMATPHVAGAVALLKSYKASLSTSELKSVIMSNVDKVSSLNGKVATGGRINLLRSFQQLNANIDLIPTMTSNTAPSGIAASSSNYDNYEYAPWKAFDGNNASGIASRWISSGNMPQWISYSFPQQVVVGSYSILPETGNCKDRSPKNFQIQGSNDGVNWKILDYRCNITLDAWDKAPLTFNINEPGSYKNYRLYVTAVNGSTVVSIQQLKLFKNSNPDLVPIMTGNTSSVGSVNASSVFSSGYEPWRAFDGNNSSGVASRWISSSNMPQWISYTFNQQEYVSSYSIFPETGGCADRAPKTFQLQGSNDGKNWTTLDSRSNITLDLWNSSAITFNVSNPGNYKTYRLYITAVNGSSVVSIQRIKLFK